MWRMEKQVMLEKIRMIFCKHRSSEVICWHWTHGYNGMDIRHLEIELRCKNCGRYLFRYIKDWNECEKFIEDHEDKRWSKTCKPVLKLNWGGFQC